MIIMLQWLRRYTLGSSGSRELKTFLKTCLISSRVDQKLKKRRENTAVLKRKIGLISWVIGAVVEVICKGHGSGSLGRRHSSGIGHELATILLQFCFEMATIFATIGPRSWSGSFVDRRSIDWRRFHQISSPIAARLRRDRGSIGPRSWSSSTKPLNRAMKL